MLPPIYKTNRFTLKPYEAIDETRFIEMATDTLTVRFLGDDDTSEQSKRDLFQKIFEIYKLQEKRWFWIWGVFANQKLVAHFELKETEYTKHNELEIVYMVYPKERNDGVMTEVLQFVKETQTLWKRNIIATVDLDNKVSISLLEKWGIEKKELIKDKKSKDKFYKIYLT